jgi:hypothetical protein
MVPVAFRIVASAWNRLPGSEFVLARVFGCRSDRAGLEDSDGSAVSSATIGEPIAIGQWRKDLAFNAGRYHGSFVRPRCPRFALPSRDRNGGQSSFGTPPFGALCAVRRQYSIRWARRVGKRSAVGHIGALHARRIFINRLHAVASSVSFHSLDNRLKGDRPGRCPISDARSGCLHWRI